MVTTSESVFHHLRGFRCATRQVIDWTQNGFSDLNILHFATHPETDEGYSPSLLGEDEVRALAAPMFGDNGQF